MGDAVAREMPLSEKRWCVLTEKGLLGGRTCSTDDGRGLSLEGPLWITNIVSEKAMS